MMPMLSGTHGRFWSNLWTRMYGAGLFETKSGAQLAMRIASYLNRNCYDWDAHILQDARTKRRA